MIDVLEVKRLDAPAAALRGAFIDLPKAGSRLESRTLQVIGWALGRDAPAAAVEFLHDGRVCGRTPVNVDRMDLERAFPDVPWAKRAGFRAALPLLPSDGGLEIELRVVLAGQVRAPLGRFRVVPWTDDAGSPNGTAGNDALVSVVIPCYNQSHFLSEAIESVLAQTYPRVELVVVDDESPDNASEVARRFPGVRCVRQLNQGLAGARNTGLRCTTGPLIVFLDSDDRLLPTALELGTRILLDREDLAFVAGSHRIIGADGSILWTAERRTIRSGQYEELLRHNYIATPGAVIYRRSVLERMGGFDTSLSVCEDYDLNLRVAREHPAHTHPNVILSYRRHASNMSGKAAIMFSTAMHVLHRQRPHTRNDPRRSQAHRDGRAFHRAYYGELLVGEIDQQIQDGRWRAALNGLSVLARHRPSGLVSLARRLRRTRRYPALAAERA